MLIAPDPLLAENVCVGRPYNVTVRVEGYAYHINFMSGTVQNLDSGLRTGLWTGLWTQ